MKTRVFFVLAAMALLAGCAKEMQEQMLPEENAPAKTVLSVGLVPQTLTYLGEGSGTPVTHHVYWSNGDKIAVNGIASDALDGIADGTSVASFSFGSSLSTPYMVLYPASIYVDESHVNLPAVQTYKAGGFADDMNPMAGRSADGSSISLNHLCAVIKISVLQETSAHAADRSGSVDKDNIRTIRFMGKADEKVSGTFEISYATPALTAATGTGSDCSVRVSHDLATDTETPVVYYLVVPARTYASGFDIVVIDDMGHSMTKSKLSSTTLVAGKLYNMTAFEFVPTVTDAGIEISSAEDLIDFVTDFNAGNIAQNAKATLTNDIVFNASTSGAFNATGGINLRGGVANTFYTGTFNGNGYTISGLEATVPLFTTIAVGAVLKDFTLEGSLTYTQPESGNDNVGPLAKQFKGTLSGVTVNTSISLVGVNRTVLLDLGGMVGRANNGSASISNCRFNGNILIPDTYTNTKRVAIGGIVGYTTQTLTIDNSSFGGTIKCLGHSTLAYSQDAPGIIIGGIVGYNQKATVQNCFSTDAISKESVVISEKEYKASIIAQSANTNFVCIGGVVGYNFDNGKVKSSCSNTTTIFDNITKESSYLEVGGVVGDNSDYTNVGTVSDASNYGVLTHMSTSLNQRLGGVIGFDEGNTTNCINETTGGVTVITAAQSQKIGGVIGEKAGGEMTGTINNLGSININALSAYGCQVGGVVGRSSVEIDGGSSKTITNSSDISITSGAVKFTEANGSNEYGLFLGGIVGYATNAIKNVSNEGNLEYVCNFTGTAETEGGAQYVHMGGIIGKLKAATLVDIEKCSNTGNLTFDPTLTAPHNNGKGKGDETYARYSYSYLGGIVGYAELANIKGDVSNKTTNSGVIKGGDNSANTNTISTFWVGGIVGKLTGASSSIEYCELIGSGIARNQHFSNASYSNYAPMCGGIAGEVLGADANHASISNCAVASTATVYATRGDIGGIVGYARYTDISNCTVSKNISSQSGYCTGGIVGWLRQGEISSSTFSGTTIRSSQMQIGGGIVGYVQNATIDGCFSDATDVSKNGTAVSGKTGGIAGYGTEEDVANNIIKNSHYKSAIVISGDNFTQGTGAEANAADR